VTLGPHERLAALVLDRSPRLGEVRLVTVDGPAGSGKTTLADGLAVALGGAPVVHMDDLYEGWAGLGPAVFARLEEWVLAPMRQGRPGHFQRYDWHAGRFADWHEVPLGRALVVEGVGAGARPVDQDAVLRIWVEASRDIRLARGIARDGEALRGEWLRWSALEDAHFAADRTRERADVIVDGESPESSR
jgi:uridine kinase